MKKIWMILLAMLLTTGLVVMGCGGGDDPPPPAANYDTVFEFSTDGYFQSLAVGTEQSGDDITAASGVFGDASKVGGNAPFANAGDIDLEVVDIGDGQIGLQIALTQAWGAGFDFLNPFFDFKNGDRITIQGKINAMSSDNTTSVGIDTSVGASAPRMISGSTTSISANNNFSVVGILGPSDLTAMNNAVNNQYWNTGDALRLRFRPAQVNTGVGLTYTITEIRVERPSDFVAVTNIAIDTAETITGEPLTLTGTVTPDNATNIDIVWSVSGDNELADVTVTDGVFLATGDGGTAKVTATIVNGKTATEDFTQDFDITVVYVEAATQTGPINVAFSDDSDLTVAGQYPDNVTAEAKSDLGSGSSNGYTVTYGEDVTEDYPNVYVSFAVVLPLGSDSTTQTYLSDYASLSFRFNGVSGDFSYKDIEVGVSDSAIDGDAKTDVTSLGIYGKGGSSSGNATLITIPLDREETLEFGDDTTTTVYVGIFVPAGRRANTGSPNYDIDPNGDITVYSIYDITFTPANPE